MPTQNLFHGFISSTFHQKSEQKPPPSWESYYSNEETALNYAQHEWVGQGSPVLEQSEYRAEEVLFLLKMLSLFLTNKHSRHEEEHLYLILQQVVCKQQGAFASFSRSDLKLRRLMETERRRESTMCELMLRAMM